ncbi:tRNA pseudouridine(55) synthase TruB [Balneola sp. MJW-20]|uniref:tRNA pseudouridine(55) synthase TruB n=1 Tax=Gracilimonas aurantiaca TaxID=3234185 RepID=UPI00346554D5
MAGALPLEKIPVYSKKNPPVPGQDYSTGAIFLINKFKDWSSFDAVKFLRSRIKVKKVGHAGTLDPMATGLLVLCAGKATKSISQIQDLEKVYRAEVSLGSSTLSYDAETEVDETAPFDHVDREMVEEALSGHFSGVIEQVPPMYSALKAGGKRLYELARQGKTIKRLPRSVTVYETKILSFDLPKIVVDIRCSKGTYIRSIAHDLGELLKTKGHLSALERTSIGHFRNEDAYSPHEIGDILQNG